MSSRVDCKWSSDKYGYRPPANTRQRKKKAKKKKQKEFVETFHHSNHHNKANQSEDDKYLFYFAGDNKVGKISRDETIAQLHDGNGSMILKTKQDDLNCIEEGDKENAKKTVQIIDDGANGNGGQLKELQHTFAAIEQAMKQRRNERQQTHL